VASKYMGISYVNESGIANAVYPAPIPVNFNQRTYLRKGQSVLFLASKPDDQLGLLRIAVIVKASYELKPGERIHRFWLNVNQRDITVADYIWQDVKENGLFPQLFTGRSLRRNEEQ
jgi:hypothetical protein